MEIRNYLGSKAAFRICSSKLVFLKGLQGLQLHQKKLQQRWFSENIAKFFRMERLRWLLLYAGFYPNLRPFLFCIFKRQFLFFPLSANPTKWPNTLKQFVGKLPTNCLSMFDHFVNLALKELNKNKNHFQSMFGLVKKIKNIEAQQKL